MKKTLLLLPLVLCLMLSLFSCFGSTEEEPEVPECTHEETTWIVDEEPTCKDEGSRFQRCVSCYKKLQTETVPATGHTFVENKCSCGSVQIMDKAALVAFGETLNYNNDFRYKTLYLETDIDFGGEAFSVIDRFAGTFEGQGHTISNVKITTSGYMQNIGFIGQCSGTVRNLTISNASISYNNESAPNSVGILAGTASGKLENCHVSGSINISSNGYSAMYYVGGLAGITDSYVDRCSAAVDISAKSYKYKGNSTFGIYAGGLVGDANYGISNSFATGNVSVGAEHYARAGGLAANASRNIENCYATGNASASIKTYGSSSYPCLAGALVAGYDNYPDDGSDYSIKNCFATGNVSASYVQKLVPLITDEVINCYYSNDAVVSGSAISAATFAGSGVDLEVIKSAAFAETLTWSADVWNFADGEFPKLK